MISASGRLNAALPLRAPCASTDGKQRGRGDAASREHARRTPTEERQRRPNEVTRPLRLRAPPKRPTGVYKAGRGWRGRIKRRAAMAATFAHKDGIIVKQQTTRALDELDVLRAKHAALLAQHALDQAKLGEAKEACPAVFAKPGDLFEHKSQRAYDDGDDIFEYGYLGRTRGSGVPPNATPSGWLKFKWIGLQGGGFWQTTGGVRDLMEAWPLRDYYLYDDQGKVVDKKIVCLPPSMCSGFGETRWFKDDEGEYDFNSEGLGWSDDENDE